MNVILYCRVSTDEQADGSSLEVQEERLRDYCARRDYTIVGDEQPYKDRHSAKPHDMKDRPKIKQIYDYCRKHKGEVDKVLFLRWDRFARNLELASKAKRLFCDELGIEINSIESPVDFKGTEWATMLGIYCGVAHTEDVKISRRTRDGIHGTLLKGRCANKAPRGYKNVNNGKHDKYVIIDESEAGMVRTAFREVAKGFETPSRIRRRVCPKVSETSFFDMLRNVFYIGKIRVPAYNGEPERIVEGRHDALIDDETFYKVQDILDGNRKGTPRMSKKIDPDLYLRKYLVCPVCGHSITGSRSRGNGGRYAYYHCSDTGKHLRKRAEEVNDGFVRYIGCLRPNKAVLGLYREVLEDVQGEQKRGAQRALDGLKKELSEVERRLENLDEKYCCGNVEDEDYKRMSGRFKQKMEDIRKKMQILSKGDKGVKTKIDYSVNLINNLTKIMSDAPVEIKCKLIGSIFSGKIKFDGENYRTTEYNKVLDLIFQETNKLRGNGNEKGERQPSFSSHVPRAGVEPARVAPLVFETSASTDSAIWA